MYNMKRNYIFKLLITLNFVWMTPEKGLEDETELMARELNECNKFIKGKFRNCSDILQCRCQRQKKISMDDKFEVNYDLTEKVKNDLYGFYSKMKETAFKMFHEGNFNFEDQIGFIHVFFDAIPRREVVSKKKPTTKQKVNSKNALSATEVNKNPHEVSISEARKSAHAVTRTKSNKRSREATKGARLDGTESACMRKKQTSEKDTNNEFRLRNFSKEKQPFRECKDSPSAEKKIKTEDDAKIKSTRRKGSQSQHELQTSSYQLRSRPCSPCHSESCDSDEDDYDLLKKMEEAEVLRNEKEFHELKECVRTMYKFFQGVNELYKFEFLKKLYEHKEEVRRKIYRYVTQNFCEHCLSDWLCSIKHTQEDDVRFVCECLDSCDFFPIIEALFIFNKYLHISTTGNQNTVRYKIYRDTYKNASEVEVAGHSVNNDKVFELVSSSTEIINSNHSVCIQSQHKFKLFDINHKQVVVVNEDAIYLEFGSKCKVLVIFNSKIVLEKQIEFFYLTDINVPAKITFLLSELTNNMDEVEKIIAKNGSGTMSGSNITKKLNIDIYLCKEFDIRLTRVEIFEIKTKITNCLNSFIFFMDKCHEAKTYLKFYLDEMCFEDSSNVFVNNLEKGVGVAITSTNDKSVSDNFLFIDHDSVKMDCSKLDTFTYRSFHSGCYSTVQIKVDSMFRFMTVSNTMIKNIIISLSKTQDEIFFDMKMKLLEEYFKNESEATNNNYKSIIKDLGIYSKNKNMDEKITNRLSVFFTNEFIGFIILTDHNLKVFVNIIIKSLQNVLKESHSMAKGLIFNEKKSEIISWNPKKRKLRGNN